MRITQPAILGVAGALLIHSSLLGQSTIKEGFDESDQRKFGDRLDKAKVESTSGAWLAWKASSNLSIGQDGASNGTVVVANEDGYTATLPIPEGNLLRIAVDLRVALVSEDGAIAVGFGNPSPGNATWLEGIFVRLDSAGKYSVAAHPNPSDPSSNYNKDPLTFLKSGAIPSFNVDGINNVVLEYDKSANALTVAINGEKVLDHADLNRWQITPATAFAGFSGWHQKTDVAPIDNFELSAQ